MDHNRYISVIKQFPQVWDRNSATFREQHLKSEAWDRISEIMNCPASICKDAFKSLREKYVREREKQIMFAEKYIPWQHLEGLSFLDPHIILRKQSLSYETDNRRLSEQKPAPVVAPQPPEDDRYLAQFAENYSDFDKTLISLVRKSSPIWDRKSNGYPSKQVKYQLWKNISQTMNKDVNICMMRWKGLREKYIRQRNKFQEGDRKWEFLDDMSFLDRVIQYRRKNGESSEFIKHLPETSFQFGRHSNHFDDSSSINDSLSNDFIPVVKHEDFGDIQDSSYDSGTSSSRKRSASDNVSESSSSMEKRDRIIEDLSQKSPEQMFGELVAAMLGKKTERDKNIAMIEIMQILTK